MMLCNIRFTNRQSYTAILRGFALACFSLLIAVNSSGAVEQSPSEHLVNKVTHSMNSFKRGISIGHWLAKFDDSHGYGGDWFGEPDIRWIGQQGFDHIRYPVDGRLWLKEDGSLDESKVAIFDRALQKTKASGMAVVLDMHFLPAGAYNKNEQDTRLFTDPLERKKASVPFKGACPL